MFYLEAENQLACIKTVLFDLIVAKMPKAISSFKELPDSVLLPVRKDTGEIVVLPIWRGAKPGRYNADQVVVANNVVTQLVEAFKTPAMIEAYGELIFPDEGALKCVHEQILCLHTYGTNVLAVARKSFAEERKAYNVIQSKQVMEIVQPGGWRAVRTTVGEGDEAVEKAVYGPALFMKSKNTVIQFGQNFGTETSSFPSDGTVKMFGVKTNIMLYNPFVRLQYVIEDSAVVEAEIRRLFGMRFPFLKFDDVFSDLQLNKMEVRTNPCWIWNTTASIRNKIDATLKVAAEVK
jgi:hypothetical protein